MTERNDYWRSYIYIDADDDVTTVAEVPTVPGAITNVDSDNAAYGDYFIDGTDTADQITLNNDSGDLNYVFGNDGADYFDIEEISEGYIIFGGDGADTIHLSATYAAQVESEGDVLSIYDFEVGTDKIDLSAIGYHSTSQISLSTSSTLPTSLTHAELGDEPADGYVITTVSLDNLISFDADNLTLYVIHDEDETLPQGSFIFGATDNSTLRGRYELSDDVPSEVTTSTYDGDKLVIDGTDGADSVVYGDGKASAILLNGGSDTLTIKSVGPSNQLIVYGGTGSDTFLLSDVLDDAVTDGTIYQIFIKDFSGDVIDVSNAGYESFDDVHVETTGSDALTYITFSDIDGFKGSEVRLVLENDTDVGTVDENDFVFADPLPVATTEGGDGDDSVTGSGELKGGDGSDTIIGSDGADTLYGGEDVSDTDDSADTLTAGAGDDLAFGNSGSDVITMGDGADNAYGGLGNDTIDGGEGHDLLAGGGGIKHPEDEADSIDGGNGDDIILGNGDNDTLNGGSGGDWILGGLGDDSISGDDGDDTVTGQTDNDTLSGGSGDDVFLFWDDNGDDVIADFDVDEDIIAIWDGLSSGVDTVAELNAFEVSGNVIVSLGNDNTITVNNSTVEDVESKIIFGDVFTDYFAVFLTAYDAAAMDYN